MSLLYLEVGGQWKMNFCWSSSLIVQSIYNRVQKVGTRTPAAASVTLPREHRLRPGSWGEPCASRRQRERPLLSQKSKWKQLWSPVLSDISASHSALMGLPPQCLHTENHTGQGKQTRFFFSTKTSPFFFHQASLPLNQLSYQKKMVFISPWKYKERLHN